jgi:hypothetical protein
MILTEVEVLQPGIRHELLLREQSGAALAHPRVGLGAGAEILRGDASTPRNL